MKTQDNRTVFVRGIPFSIDQQPFEEAFADVAPVKQCFLVRDKGAPKHKGCGFVQYALPEDAQRAVEEMNGKVLGGRKLQVKGAWESTRVNFCQTIARIACELVCYISRMSQCTWHGALSCLLVGSALTAL